MVSQLRIVWKQTVSIRLEAASCVTCVAVLGAGRAQRETVQTAYTPVRTYWGVAKARETAHKHARTHARTHGHEETDEVYATF